MTDEHDENSRRATDGQNDAERESQVDYIIERIERLATAAKASALNLAARLLKNKRD